MIEPTTKLIRYVGKTQQCYEIRYRNHLKLRAGGRSKKDSWIFDLLKKRQKPDVIILSLHRSKKALDRKERYWIRHLTNLGFDLLNGTDGGTGGVQTEEVRRKMSTVQKKHFSNPANRKKLSEAHKERYRRNPEHRVINSNAKKKYFEDPKNRKKQSDRIKKTYEDGSLGRLHSDIQKQKWKDPEYRKKHEKILEETRRKTSEQRRKSLKKTTNTKEYREKASLARGGKPFSVFKEGKYVGTWFSQSLCSEALTNGKMRLKIKECLTGKRKSSGGFTFRWKKK